MQVLVQALADVMGPAQLLLRLLQLLEGQKANNIDSALLSSPSFLPVFQVLISSECPLWKDKKQTKLTLPSPVSTGLAEFLLKLLQLLV